MLVVGRLSVLDIGSMILPGLVEDKMMLKAHCQWSAQTKTLPLVYQHCSLLHLHGEKGDAR